MHARAWSNPLFVEAFEHETRTWCVNCHAPLQTQGEEYRRNPGNHATGLLAEGINCVACHVRNGKILATVESGRAPHDSVRSSYLKSSNFCADCHQFNFPTFHASQIEYTSEPMQDTFEEYRASGYTRNCHTCHYDGHRLLGPHQKDWFRQHFSGFHAERSAPGLGSVRFEVDSFRAHNLPSGDLFKSLAFQAAHDPHFQRIFFQKKWARTYGIGMRDAGTIWNRRLILNSSLSPEENKVHITFDLPGDGPIYVRLVYFLHDPRLGGKSRLPSQETEIQLWSHRIQ